MKHFPTRRQFAGLLALVLGIAPQAGSQERYSMSGMVLDAETGLPLANASVFIDKSLIGGVTDSSGTFAITNVPPGTFNLLASLIGYAAQKREITIAGESQDQLVFKLRPTMLQGPEIVITADQDKRWRRDFEKFSGLLLSNTKNVEKTRILNAHQLTFSENEAGQFQATARAPLVIENHALGYRLDLVLSEFYATSQSLRYSGFTKFEELAPVSEEQSRQWQKNRLRAYKGSLRHFLAIICDTLGHIESRLKEQGFEVFTFQKSWDRETRRIAEPVNWRTFFGRSKVANEIRLSFLDYLGIKYLHEFEERGFLRHHQFEREPRAQESWIKLGNAPIRLDRSGRYLDDAAIMKYGYWAWERLADMLPLEFKP